MNDEAAARATFSLANETSEPALVPSGGFYEGQVAVSERTRIDGTVRGTLRGPGELVLGREARVEGQIDCAVVSSQGHVIGPITAHERAELGAGARFEGDLDAPILEVHDDAIWVGRAKVGE